VNVMSHLVNDVMVEMRGERMLCHSRGKMSILDPMSNSLWDENKTREAHNVVGHSCVILVSFGVVVLLLCCCYSLCHCCLLLLFVVIIIIIVSLLLCCCCVIVGKVDNLWQYGYSGT